MISVVFALVLTIVLAVGAYYLITPEYERSTICKGLFVIKDPADDSGPFDPHIPVEAQASEPTPMPRTEWTTRSEAASDCVDGLPLLSVDTIIEGPGGFAFFRISPSGRQLVSLTWGGPADGVHILDLEASRSRRLMGGSNRPHAWLSEDLLLMQADTKRIDPKTTASTLEWYVYDIRRDERIRLDLRYEYHGLDAQRFTGPYYTGWQAARLLALPVDTICRAARRGTLQSTVAADGSLLLSRDDLLNKGPSLVRAWQPILISTDEIVALRRMARDVYVIKRPDTNRPLPQWSGGGANFPSNWSHSLVLLGLPGRPSNVLVHVDSTRHWEGYPLVANQVRVDSGAIESRSPDPDSGYVLRRDACHDPRTPGYRHVLYRHANEDLVPVGLIPFPSDAYEAQLFWSPDGGSLYFDQEAFGRYSISRLHLPASNE
jgi:hypothetical protein